MREPSFWWSEAGIVSGMLAPLAALYGTVAAARLDRRGARAGAPVVCVGNLTVGGAGKTPTALELARMLATAGERPVFLTRGYGGRLPGPVQADPARHGANDVGDEPLLLARTARSPSAQASSSWMTASRIPRWSRTFQCWSSTPVAPSAAAV
jgi:tetraacyldisaccharide 4'-kinase